MTMKSVGACLSSTRNPGSQTEACLVGLDSRSGHGAMQALDATRTRREEIGTKGGSRRAIIIVETDVPRWMRRAIERSAKREERFRSEAVCAGATRRIANDKVRLFIWHWRF